MTKGNLIGYTTGGLPIYNYQTPQSVLNTVQSLLRQIVEQSESRQIFYFLCLNLVSKNSTYQPIISFGPVFFLLAKKLWPILELNLWDIHCLVSKKWLMQKFWILVFRLCKNPLSLFSYCSNSLVFVIYCNLESKSVLTPANLLACYVILDCCLLKFPVGQHDLLFLYVLWK